MSIKYAAVAICAMCIAACAASSDQETLIKQYKKYCESPIEVKPQFFRKLFVQKKLSMLVGSSDEELLTVIRVVRNQLDMCGRLGATTRFEYRSGDFEFLTVQFDLGRDNLENKVELAYVFEDGEWLIAQTKMFGPPNYP